MTIMSKQKLLPICFFLLVSNSCVPAVKGTESIECTVTDSQITRAPIIQKTETEAPTLTTTLLVSTDFPTFTPLPTLGLEEAQELVLELFKTNAGCNLPCWWGITPGESSWSDTYHFLSQFGTNINIGGSMEDPSFIAYFQVPIPEDMYPYYFDSQDYHVVDNVVVGIEVFTDRVSRYSLKSILVAHGPPSEIWIWTYQNEYAGLFPIVLIFFYSDIGIMASFSGDAARDADIVRSCLRDEIAGKLFLWSPSQELSFIEALDITREFDLRDVVGDPISIEEASGISISVFYKSLTETDNTLCLVTPYDIWPPQP
jgi:hypothetical protein